MLDRFEPGTVQRSRPASDYLQRQHGQSNVEAQVVLVARVVVNLEFSRVHRRIPSVRESLMLRVSSTTDRLMTVARLRRLNSRCCHSEKGVFSLSLFDVFLIVIVATRLTIIVSFEVNFFKVGEENQGEKEGGGE